MEIDTVEVELKPKDIEEIKNKIKEDLINEGYVKVIRCKGCKYYKKHISNWGSAMMCFCPCCMGGQGKKEPTDYCSYGEKKDEHIITK